MKSENLNSMAIEFQPHIIESSMNLTIRHGISNKLSNLQQGQELDIQACKK